MKQWISQQAKSQRGRAGWSRDLRGRNERVISVKFPLASPIDAEKLIFLRRGINYIINPHNPTLPRRPLIAINNYRVSVSNRATVVKIMFKLHALITLLPVAGWLQNKYLFVWILIGYLRTDRRSSPRKNSLKLTTRKFNCEGQWQNFWN